VEDGGVLENTEQVVGVSTRRRRLCRGRWPIWLLEATWRQGGEGAAGDDGRRRRGGAMFVF
jgi:hypothetical protein